jgi:hypothetical protein
MSNWIKVVVRLTSSKYFTNGNLVITKKLSLLKRLSNGSLEDLIHDLDCDEIDLLEELKDGIYELTPYEYGYDWETGCCDGYRLKLVAYSPSSENYTKAVSRGLQELL